MRIRVDDIPDEGLHVEIDNTDDWAFAAAATALEGPVHELQVELTLTRIAELLRVHGTASARAGHRCARCGGDLEISVGGTVELLYEPIGKPESEEVHLTDPADLDVGFFDGQALDLVDVIMEQFALWLPDKVVCGGKGTKQVGEPWKCSVAPQPEVPGRENPFAKLRLPD